MEKKGCILPLKIVLKHDCTKNMFGFFYAIKKTGQMLTVHMPGERGVYSALRPLYICLEIRLLLLPQSQEVESRMLFSCKGFRAEKRGNGDFGDGSIHPHLVRKDLHRNFKCLHGTLFEEVRLTIYA